MTPEILQIHDTIRANASLFLRKAVVELVNDSDAEDAPLSRDAAVVACVFLQMAIELATKAAIVRRSGIANILEPRRHAADDEPALAKKFSENAVATVKYEKLKHFMKAGPDSSHYCLNEADWYFLDTFQQWRNKLVHIHYNFSPEDLADAKIDMTYVLAHTLPHLLLDGEERPAELLMLLLGKDTYRSLVRYRPYIVRMERLVCTHDGKAFACPECGEKTFNLEDRICYCCNWEYHNSIGFVGCGFCGTKNSVVYDALNIGENVTINAQCLACGETCDVAKCAGCGEVSVVGHRFVRSVTEATCPFCETPLASRQAR